MMAPRDPQAPRGGIFKAAKESLFPSRKAPARTTTQAAQVRDRKYGGNTKAMAAAYNVSPRTVLRWIDGTRKKLAPEHTERLQQEATEVQTTPRGRERRARQLEGRTVSGYSAKISRATTFQIRGSDAVRPRDVDVDLTGQEAAALIRSTDPAEAEQIIADALARYFNGGSLYGGFNGTDFTFDPHDFQLR
ncbi:hypothetical protein [Streptomyces sp. NPDC048639]|uniref:hypothetical protein n=1 Tax=Streptomyces sp. NPDC048639 TaxID=3365581 RepID=UPI003718F8A8